MAGRNEIEVRATLKDELSSGLTKATAGVSAFKSQVSAMAAALTAGGVVAALTGMANGLRSVGDEYERLANAQSKTGATINQVKVLGQAFKEAGLTADDSVRAMAFLSREIERGNPLLKEMGVTSLNTYEAMLQLSDAVTKSANAGANNAAVMELMSRAGMNSLPALKGLRENVSAITTDLSRMGGLWSDFDVSVGKSADKLNDSVMRKFDSLVGRLKLIAASIAIAAANGRMVGGVGGAFVPGSVFGVDTLPGQIGTQGGFSVQGATVEASRRSGGGGGRGGVGIYNPGFATYDLRGTVAGSAGYQRLLAQSVSGNVPQVRNTFDMGNQASLERTRQAMATFSASVEGSFQNMFSRVFAIQTRSNNVIVTLFADLANSIVAALSQRLASSAANFVLDIIPIPGLGAAGSAASASSGTVININTLQPASLVSEALSPSGGLRAQGVRLAQIAAVR